MIRYLYGVKDDIRKKQVPQISPQNSKQILQNQYNEICKSLGDAYYKRKQLDSLIQQLESQLEHLNSVSYPLINLIDSQNNQASKEQK